MDQKKADVYEVKKQVCPETGFVFIECHFKNNVLHKEDGPAKIVRTPKGSNFAEYRQVDEWYLDGIANRLDNGPTMIVKEMPHENVVSRLYEKDGLAYPSPLSEP